MATERGLVAQQMRALTNAVVQRIDEDPWRAFELGAESIEQAVRYGVRPAVVYAVLNWAEIALRVGEWDRAGAEIDRALSLDLEASDRMILLYSAAILALFRGRRDDDRYLEFESYAAGHVEGLLAGQVADLTMVRGQLDGAYAAVVDTGIEQAESDELNAPSSYERAARAALWMGDGERARAIERAFAALGRSAPFPAAQLLAVQAGLAAIDGRRDEALDRYREALRRYRDLRLAFDGALVGLDAARLLGANTPEGAAALQEARTTFERLDARPLVEAADGLLSVSGRARLGARRAAGVARG
jgi:tetratricopeptide (TPR) repeat protein